MLRAMLVVGVLCSAPLSHAQSEEEEPILERWLETDGCVGSLECEEYGLCQRLGVLCVAVSADDCRRSLACRTSGFCQASRGQCVSDPNRHERYSKGLMGAGIAMMGLGAASIIGCLPIAWLGPICTSFPMPPAGYAGSLTTFSVLLNAGIVMTAVGAAKVDGPGASGFRVDANGIAFGF